MITVSFEYLIFAGLTAFCLGGAAVAGILFYYDRPEEPRKVKKILKELRSREDTAEAQERGERRDV
jgi:hypothetical protein